MSEILATSPAMPDEAPTVEGRLADIIETAEVRIDEYRLSDSDRKRLVSALRLAASQPDREAIARTMAEVWLGTSKDIPNEWTELSLKFADRFLSLAWGINHAKAEALAWPTASDSSPGPYDGEMVVPARLLHALWCYGNLYPVTGVIYSPGSHQECLAQVDALFRDRAALTRPLGGFVQGSIADGGQCNEQSGKQPSPAWPQNLHPRTLDMVQRFAVALAKKLRLAEEKYGFGDGWADDHWEKECLAHFHSHIEKGDPLDVAAYCAFMWHHRWITYPAAVADTDADAKRDDGLLSGVSADPT